MKRLPHFPVRLAALVVLVSAMFGASGCYLSYRLGSNDLQSMVESGRHGWPVWLQTQEGGVAVPFDSEVLVTGPSGRQLTFTASSLDVDFGTALMTGLQPGGVQRQAVGLQDVRRIEVSVYSNTWTAVMVAGLLIGVPVVLGLTGVLLDSVF